MYVEPEDLSNEAKSFKNLGYDVQVAETVWMPLPEGQQQLEASSEQAQKISTVIDALEAEDEVTGVFSNVIFDT